MNQAQLHAQIMRRVYYSFALSIVTHAMFWHGLFLSVAAVLLARWLHVSSIVQNFLSIPVGSAPGYILNAFTNAAQNGELLTVLTLLLAGMLSVSVGWRLLHTVTPHLRTLLPN